MGQNRGIRFIQPIGIFKNISPTIDKKEYKQVNVSFQSSSSTNITTINYLNTKQLFLVIKDRVQGKNKI